MAQFGGKNPPWARDVVGQAGVTMVGNLAGQQMLSQPGIATQATVYSLGGGQPQPHQFSVQQPGGVPGLQGPLMHHQAAALQQSVQLPQPGIAIPTTLATTQVATVSYPAPRAAGQGPQPKQRVFTGAVTKLHDNFGFVDEDVFFQTSCVKGNIPKVGDRVLVEAAYNANMPFKWNATRIQVLPTQPQPGSNPVQGSGNFSAQPRPMGPGISQSQMHPTPLMGQQINQGGRSGGGGGGRDGGGMGNSGGVSSGSGYRDRDRGGHGESNSSRHMSNNTSGGHNERSRSHRSDRDRRSPPRTRRSRSPRRRSRSPSRTARSPPRSRRPPRVVPRYTVQIPKLSLDTKEANVMTLKSRYSNMYIPSDFFNAAFTWTEAFPTHRPLQLGQPCTFHVMHKEVDAIVKHEAVLEPPDADHLFSAKVMLMASPTLEELYKRSCALAEDSSEVRDSFQHPTRLLNFLVGLKGKSEPMAIGGPWSPSLDGANPATDPRTLINTAIRTTRALTGIDLAVCTQWYRFAEIRYHRPEEVHKGRTLPARVETVVIFLPDVWSCNPSRLEWEQMASNFKKQLSDKLVDENKDETTQEDEEDGEEGSEEKKDPSHFSELDPKTMKVNDLRKELEARSLSSKGLKSQLIARLTKALKSEQEKEEQEAADQKEEEDNKQPEPEKEPELDDKDEEKKKREEEERKRREERDRAARERRYNLPENPAILVHPSTTAKGGKFDCTVMSLSVLLDYRPDDNKEHTFEVSLFAELFNEMLMRDCGFCMYKALVAAPEKPKEEKKDKKDKEKEKEKDKDDKEKKDSKDKDKEEKKEKDKDKEKEKDKEDDEPPSKRRKSSHDEEKDKKDEKEKEKDKDDEKKEKDEKKKDDKDKKDDDEDDDDEDDDKSTTTSDGRRKKSKDGEKKREKVKYFTANPQLLLSFVYFDQSHAGYLLDKDMEEILHTLGLSLSRAQVKKTVAKLVTRDTLNYRKITDKPRPKEDSKKEEVPAPEAEVAAAEAGEGKATEVDQTASVEPELEDDETLAMGNKPLLASPKRELSAPMSTPSRSSKRGAGAATASAGKKDDGAGEGATGIVTYKGAILDINSVMTRLEKSEKTKRDTEAKLKETQEDMDMLKSSFNSSEQNSQKVALELQELKKKLRDQRKATERGEHDAKKYYEVLAKARGPLSSMLQDIKDVTGTGFKSASSSSSSSESTVKVEPKEEVNGD